MEMERKSAAQDLKYDCLVFDLDDTLYPASSGIGALVTENIKEYAVKKLGIDEGRSDQITTLLYKHYGTTLAGLKAVGHQFDVDDYHRFVHGQLPYEKIKPDPVLRHILQSLPVRKIVFTNSDEAHAQRALKRLDINDCFERIICFETLNPAATSPPPSSGEIFDILSYSSAPQELPKTPILCKPSVPAMKYAFQLTGVNPHTTIMFDDSVRNILSAKRIGLHTVLVGRSERSEGADCALESLHNLKEALPELWELEADKDEDVRQSSKAGIETSVIA